jgi:hypothetical protein
MFLLDFKNEGMHKVIIIFGLKIKVKLKRLQQKQELIQQKEREQYYKHYYIHIADPIKNVVIQKATEGKKIIIYGKHEFAERFQFTLNLNIAYCVDDNIGIYNKSARNVYDLAYEAPESFFAVVIQPDYHKPKIFSVMTGLGLIRGIDYDIMSESSALPTSVRDIYLGFSRVYNEYDNCFPGFKIYGNVNGKSLRIATLGGSTTDPTFMGIASWPECLYYILNEDRLREEFCVFNGGFAGYMSSNELLKLIRDVFTLKPDIIISYSGLNDFMYSLHSDLSPRYKRPFIDTYQEALFKFISQQEGKTVLYGMQTDKDAARFWADSQRIMHAISEEMGIKYIGILQANVCSEEKMSKIIEGELNYKFRDESMRDPIHILYNYLNAKSVYNKAENNVKKLPYILNFRHIFDDFNDYDVYYDECHVYEHGNEVIAANVYESLLKKRYI